MTATRPVTFMHTSSTQRTITLAVPVTIDDTDQWFYENVDETDGEITGGGWGLDETIEPE